MHPSDMLMCMQLYSKTQTPVATSGGYIWSNNNNFFILAISCTCNLSEYYTELLA